MDVNNDPWGEENVPTPIREQFTMNFLIVSYLVVGYRSEQTVEASEPLSRAMYLD